MGSIVTYTYKDAGKHTLTIPEGYADYALIYAWGAGGGAGTNGPESGGAGGFAFAAIAVQSGDELVIAPGGAGGSASGNSNFGKGGYGVVLSGSASTTYNNSTIVNSPSKVENGFFTRTAHPNTNPWSGIRQWYIMYQGELIYSSSSPPPEDIKRSFQPGTYRGGVYSTAIGGPGGGDELNHFDLIADTSVSLRGGDGAVSWDEDGDAGASAGGVGASAVLVNGSPVVVAAGGGGGGGYGDDHWRNTTNPGQPGGLQVGDDSIAPWYPVSDGRWGSFINTYGIWMAPTGGDHSYTARIYFPTAGTYTFYASSDNNSSWRVDSGTTYTTSFTQFSSYTTETETLTKGWHTITATISNPGDVGGWALRIMNPDSSELWHTRKPTSNTGLNKYSMGQKGSTGGGGSGGGGGGYPYGGARGKTLGDDQPGSWGGNGGQNFTYSGNVTVGGNVIVPIVEPGTLAGKPGGFTNVYYPGSTRGFPGVDGAIVVILTKSFRAWVKDSGSWKAVNDAWVKVNGDWKRIIKGWIKANGAWKALEADITSGPTKLSGAEISDRVNINLYYDGTSESDANVLVDTNNVNVFGEVYNAGYVLGKTTINLTIDANAVITSTSVASPALTINNFAVGDKINIINNGTISGKDTSGNAIVATVPVTITNNGTISGGSPDGYYISGNSYVTWGAIGTVTGNTD